MVQCGAGIILSGEHWLKRLAFVLYVFVSFILMYWRPLLWKKHLLMRHMSWKCRSVENKSLTIEIIYVSPYYTFIHKYFFKYKYLKKCFILWSQDDDWTLEICLFALFVDSLTWLIGIVKPNVTQRKQTKKVERLLKVTCYFIPLHLIKN